MEGGAVRIEDYRITPSDLDDGAWRMLGLVDLDAWPTDAPCPVLPPYPVIGIGDAGHPFAGRLDCVIEPPVSLASLVATVAKAPQAAAALVQLLRSIAGAEAAPALVAESLCLAMLQGSAEHRAWLDARPPAGAQAPAGAVIVTREGSKLRVTIDRPGARGAIDRAVRDGLHDAFALAALDCDIDTVSLRGTGASFSIGADLAEFGTTRDPATAHLIRARTLPAHMLARRPGLLEAHVQGACIGAALEMVAFARRITATRRAWFQLPEIAMGIIPGAGGCVSVPRRIGRQRAALMMLSGRRIDAATALRWGLIDAIVDAPPAGEHGADMIG